MNEKDILGELGVGKIEPQPTNTVDESQYALSTPQVDEADTSIPSEAVFDLQTKPEELRPAQPEKEVTTLEAFGHALKANLPFMYENDNPRYFDKDWREEDKNAFFDDVKNKYGQDFHDDLFNRGTWNTNELYAKGVFNNMKKDLEHQEKIYKWGGVSGSIVMNLAAGLANPVDIALMVGTGGVNKLFRLGESIDVALRLGDITAKQARLAKATIFSAEGMIVGYGSEKIRQESSDFTNTQDLQMVTAAGGLLGGAFGALGKTNIRLSDEAIERMSSSDKKRLVEIQEEEALKREELAKEMEESRIQDEAKYDAKEKIGDTEIRMLDDEDFGTMSDTTKWLSIPNPVKNAFGVNSKTYQSIARTLTSPFFIMKNEKGEKITMNRTTANDTKEMLAAKADITITEQGQHFKSFNESRKKNGQEALNRDDYDKLIISEKRKFDAPILKIEEELNFKISKLADLNSKKRTSASTVGEIDTLKGEIDLLNAELKDAVANKQKSASPEIQASIDAFENYFDYYKKFDQDVKDAKRLNKINLELPKKEKELDDFVKANSKRLEEDDISRSISDMELEIRDMKRELTSIEYRKKGINSRTYIPTVYKDEELINNRATYLKDVKDALRKSNPKTTETKLEEIAEDWINKLEQKYIGTGELSKKGSGKYDSLNGIHNSSRTLSIDKEILSSKGLVNDNAMELVMRYNEAMSGKAALRKHLGVTNISELSDLQKAYMDEMRANGATNKEIKSANENLSKMIDIISGDYNIVRNPSSTMQVVKRTIMPISNITYGLNFGMTSIAEAGQLISQYGVRNFTKQIGKSFKNTLRKYKNDPHAIPLNSQMELAGVGSNISSSRVMSRFNEGEEVYYTRSKYLDALKYAENKVFHGGGLILITDSFKDTSATLFLGYAKDAGQHLLNGKKISKKMENDFARYGLSNEDLMNIARHEFGRDEKGNIIDLKLDNIPNGSGDRLQVAMNRSTKGSVLEPNSLDLPYFMTDKNNPMGQLMTQYMRFLFDAHNKLLVAGIDEANVSAITAVMYSSVIAGSILFAREELLSQAGLISDNKRKFDLDTEIGIENISKATINRVPHLGAFTVFFNKTAPFFGVSPLGTEYLPNPFANVAGAGFSKVETATQAVGDLVTNPGEFTNKQRQAIQQNSIIGSIPFLGDIFKAMTREER